MGAANQNQPQEVIDSKEASNLKMDELNPFVKDLPTAEKFITDNTDQAVQIVSDRINTLNKTTPEQKRQVMYLTTFVLYAVEGQALAKITAQTDKQKQNDILKATASVLSDLIGYTIQEDIFDGTAYDQFGRPLPKEADGKYKKGTLVNIQDQTSFSDFFKEHPVVTAGAAAVGVGLIAESIITGVIASGVSAFVTSDKQNEKVPSLENSLIKSPLHGLAVLIENSDNVFQKKAPLDNYDTKLLLWRQVLHTTGDPLVLEALSDQRYAFRNPLWRELKQWLDTQKGRTIDQVAIKAEAANILKAGIDTKQEWIEIKKLRAQCATFLKGYNVFYPLVPGFTYGGTNEKTAQRKAAFDQWRGWQKTLLLSDKLNFDAMETKSQVFAQRLLVYRVKKLGAGHDALLKEAEGLSVPEDHWSALITVAQKLQAAKTAPPETIDWETPLLKKKYALLEKVRTYGEAHPEKAAIIFAFMRDLNNFEPSHFQDQKSAEKAFADFEVRWGEIVAEIPPKPMEKPTPPEHQEKVEDKNAAALHHIAVEFTAAMAERLENTGCTLASYDRRVKNLRAQNYTAVEKFAGNLDANIDTKTLRERFKKESGLQKTGVFLEKGELLDSYQFACMLVHTLRDVRDLGIALHTILPNDNGTDWDHINGSAGAVFDQLRSFLKPYETHRVE